MNSGRFSVNPFIVSSNSNYGSLDFHIEHKAFSDERLSI